MRLRVLLVLSVFAGQACTNEMRFFPAVDLGAGASGTADDAGVVPDARGAAGGSATAAAPLGPSGNWELTFREECGGALNPLWYTYWAWEAPRTQAHTAEYVADERVVVTDGLCVITADDTPNGDRPYTSGTLNTASRFEQEYGYFEARLKVPGGVGLWTDWRLRSRTGWPPAIDVGNVFGRDVRAARFAHYWGEPYPNHTFWAAADTSTDFSLEHHVYGVEWSASELVWYVDGVERARTQVAASEQIGQRFLSLTIMVGTGEDPAEPPDATTTWPVELSIDWVRAWRRL